MKRSWIPALLLFALVIYLWVPTLFTVMEVEHEQEPDLISTPKEPAVTRRSLDENTVIAKGNLRGAPQEKNSAPIDEIEAISPEKIPVADKSLGLSLVGTVIRDDPDMNIAFIYSRSTRQQEPYHEGDRVGEVLVKGIFWNKVIIETEKGEALLVMSFEGPPGGSSPSFSPSSEDSRYPSFTDLEPTVSSGPLYGGSSSGKGAETRDGGNVAVKTGGSTLGGGPAAAGGSDAATGSGDWLRSSRSSFENSRSSSSESEEGESSLADPEPSVSSGPL